MTWWLGGDSQNDGEIDNKMKFSVSVTRVRFVGEQTDRTPGKLAWLQKRNDSLALDKFYSL